jgi:hypothetical protein
MYPASAASSKSWSERKMSLNISRKIQKNLPPVSVGATELSAGAYMWASPSLLMSFARFAALLFSLAFSLAFSSRSRGSCLSSTTIEG